MKFDESTKWQTIDFQEFVTINPKILLIKGQDYLFVDMESIIPGKKYVRAKGKKRFEGGGARFQVGDTLFARITPCLENGKIAQFKDINLQSMGFGSTEFFIFRGKEGISASSFVFYLASSQEVRKTAEKSMSGASGRQRADLASIRTLKLNLPPFEVQQKIAAILSAYDDLIENNSRRVQILEEMARTIYQEWFVKFRFPGYEKIKFVESPKGMIPEGWEVGTLKNFCFSTTYGYTASAQKDPIGPKFLRITDIVPDFIDWDNVPYCEISEKEESKYFVEEGDIVVARTGATVGYAKRLNKRHPKTVFASYLVRLRLSIKCANLYVGLLVESDEYKAFIKANASGAAQPQANAQVLTSIPLVMPPIQILQRFNSLIQPLLDQKEVLEQKNMNLRRTRDLLLPKLLSGQINVSDLDIQM